MADANARERSAPSAHILNYSTQQFDSHNMYAPAVTDNVLQRRQHKYDALSTRSFHRQANSSAGSVRFYSWEFASANYTM